MLTKEYVKEVAFKGNGEIDYLINEQKDVGTINFILESIGKIPANFDSTFLYNLLEHSHAQVRLNSVKNIGKLNGKSDTQKLTDLFFNETDTNVRREIISSIGRQRKIENKSFLFAVLEDTDPKIVCQAVRALLVFKGNEEIDNRLQKLINHQNETVKAVINKEYFLTKNKTENLFPHAQTYDYLKNVVVHGDVREVLQFVPNESIHLTFTSPPYYNARDYAIYPSYEAYLQFLEEIFLETYRITKEGRFLIVNTSPVIVPRISRSHSSKRYPIPFDVHHFLVKMGWEFIDDIVWMKPEYSVKNRIGGFQQHRKPLAYKPNNITEYVMVYRKQTEKLLDWNIRQYDFKTVEESKVADGFETNNVWKIDPKSDKIHSAVFPTELCTRVIEYYSFKGDVVFDPFAGSGTLGKTAKKLGRKFFLTEKETIYFEYIKTLINQNDMFQDEKAAFLSLEQFKERVK